MKKSVSCRPGIRKLLLVAATLAAILAGCSGEGQQSGDQPPTVDVQVVTLKTETIELKSTLAGRVVSTRTAEIRPQVSGIILERLFDEGSQVEAGQPLYQIDPALYEAELTNAQGQLAVAQANEHAAELRAKRISKLVQTGAVSKQEFDEAEAAWLQAQASRKAAEAAVNSAQINLDYTTVRAPIRGVISRSQVTEGALVSAQQATPLATIRQLSPIYVDVPRPAAELIAIQRQADNPNPEVHLQLEDGSQYAETGYLKFSEANVDSGTGTVVTRSEFANADGLLLPGMFVRASLVSEELQEAVLAPQRGIAIGADGGASAMVVDEDNRAEMRQLKLRKAIGDRWLVSGGLAAGDQLIVSGLQKIQPGSPVNPSEFDTSEQAAPTEASAAQISQE